MVINEILLIQQCQKVYSEISLTWTNPGKYVVKQKYLHSSTTINEINAQNVKKKNKNEESTDLKL